MKESLKEPVGRRALEISLMETGNTKFYEKYLERAEQEILNWLKAYEK